MRAKKATDASFFRLPAPVRTRTVQALVVQRPASHTTKTTAQRQHVNEKRRTVEALVVQGDQPVQPDLLVLAQLALDEEGRLQGRRKRNKLVAQAVHSICWDAAGP